MARSPLVAFLSGSLLGSARHASTPVTGLPGPGSILCEREPSGCPIRVPSEDRQ